MKLKKNNEKIKESATKRWFDLDLFITLKTEWLMFIYLLILMIGYNFMSHGSQNLYPTLLVNDLGVSANQKTVIMVLANIGVICGGVFFGQLTELLGRRLIHLIACFGAGAFLYPSFYLRNLNGVTAGYFFLNFCIMGGWGVVPLHLIELVSTRNRATLSGLVYQLGNLASSCRSTIEAELGAKYPKPNGTYDYSRVMCIFCGSVFAYITISLFLGPERFHRNLDIEVSEEDESDFRHFPGS